MVKLLYIALGGAAGSVLRHGVSVLAHRSLGHGFPWGTLSVNLLGSLIIGLLFGVFDTIIISHNARVFLLIGLLGAFTTFSTFTLENYDLVQNGQFTAAFINIAVSFTLGIALVFAGVYLSRTCLTMLGK